MTESTIRNVDLLKANVALAWFGLTKIPMLAFVGARWLHLDADRAVIKVPLGYRTRNHLRCMYFGSMAVGADLVIGGLAFYLIRRQSCARQLIFKDFQAEYLKRAEGDTHFICERGDLIQDLVAAAATGEERVNARIPAYAVVPAKLGTEPVARFGLTLSIKRKS